jgi:hypothetical protein
VNRNVSEVTFELACVVAMEGEELVPGARHLSILLAAISSMQGTPTLTLRSSIEDFVSRIQEAPKSQVEGWSG